MKSSGPRFGLHRIIWIAAFLGAVTALLAWTTWREMTTGEDQIERLMAVRATSIADIMAESGRHSLDVYQRWEDEIAGRLLDNARWVAVQDSASAVTSDQLERFAAGRHDRAAEFLDCCDRRIDVADAQLDARRARILNPAAYADNGEVDQMLQYAVRRVDRRKLTPLVTALRANLLAAIQTAASPAARDQGCLAVLADEIHAARWVTKTHSTSGATFRSLDTGPLGYVLEGTVRMLNHVPTP